MENKLLLIGAIALFASALYLTTNLSTTSTDSAVPLEVQQAFTSFQTKYNKRYAGQDKSYRLQVFYENYQKIETHNANPDATYVLGETQFMDLTEEEFIHMYLMNLDDFPEAQPGPLLATEDVPNDVDWRDQGVVQKVKNQGQCGSCWAFSTVGALESFFKITTGETVDLAEQQLVDCTNDGKHICHGCSGGWPYEALRWTQENGMVTQDKYPYAARNQACKVSSGPYKNGGFTKVPVARNGSQLKSALAKTPVSVCIDASKWSLYTGGVVSECGTSINHAVLLVAYKNSEWVIKNSWGTGWGEQGFIRLADGDTCGITGYAVYPTK